MVAVDATTTMTAEPAAGVHVGREGRCHRGRTREDGRDEAPPRSAHMEAGMDPERQVAEHHVRGGLERAILDALSAGGKELDRLAPADLSGIDEFHLGGRAATIELARDLGLAPGMRVLDIGSGLGGPARHFAEAHGCRVAGVDLAHEFVQAAAALTRRCGLADRVTFAQASALALPFADGSFDAATLIHVGMAIEDKAKLLAEARRVVRRGASFGVYDVMRAGDGEIPQPMPWATTAAASFVEPADAYRCRLAAAGFAIERTCDRRELALTQWRARRAATAQDGRPPLGLHLLMGATARQRFGNVMRTLERGIIAPIEIVARAM